MFSLILFMIQNYRFIHMKLLLKEGTIFMQSFPMKTVDILR